MEDGKHELDGSRLYVSVVSIFGKEKKDAAIETHKKYIDIQMPLLGVEKIGWKPGCELQEESTPYNEQKDIAGSRLQVRNPIPQGWYPNSDSSQTGVQVSQSPTYPVHAVPNPSIKLE